MGDLLLNRISGIQKMRGKSPNAFGYAKRFYA